MPDLTLPDGTPVPPFAFGAMQFGGRADASESQAMFEACRAAGIAHFDTAHVYNEGRSEELLGKFAQAERDRLFIATKCAAVGGSGAANIRAQFDDSRRRLGMDFVDLLYLHLWDDKTPLEDSIAALAGLVHARQVRHVAVSNFAAWQVMKAARVAEGLGVRIAALQPMYNLVKRQAEVEILPMAISEDFAVFPYSPLGGGLLSGKYAAGEGGRLVEDTMYTKRYREAWRHDVAAKLAVIGQEIGVSAVTLAVAWAARHPGVTGPIVSARNTAQLASSLDAIGFDMDDALYERLWALSPAPAPATDRSENR